MNNRMSQYSENIKSAAGWIVILVLLGAWAYNSWVVQPENQRRRHEARKTDDSQRFQNWAYVAKEKQIAPGESIRLVIVPHPTGIEFMDTKCLIYTHQEFKTSSMVCPDAKQRDIEEKE